MEQVNLGMIGGGTVGGGVYQALRRNGALMASRLGVKIKVRKIAVKALDEPRAVHIPNSLLTTDWTSVVNDPKVHIIAELAGGTTIARTMILAALKKGKPVVTANKALLSAHGEELFATAQRHGTNLYYEASVAGGIPIIKALREGFVGNRITHVYGIFNGTCNYILTRMDREGVEFEPVLKEAQQLGYAEAEPSLDVDGYDSMHKIGIVASLAHGFWVHPKEIHVEGIRSITALDSKFASQLGYTIKLLGVVKKMPGKGQAGFAPIQVSVYPALIPHSHVLASVSDVFNAVFVRGDVVGDTLFYGKGAGQDATASAVLSDIADAILDLKFGTKNRIPPMVSHETEGAVLPMDRVVCRYYVRANVIDRPGTLAKISAAFAKAKIGISSVIQPEGHEGESVSLIMMTHEAPGAAMRKALSKVAQLNVVNSAPVMFRVESLD